MSMPNLPAPSGDHPDFLRFDTPGTVHTVRVDEVWSFTSTPFPGSTAQPSEVFAISGVTPEGAPASISMGGTGSRHHLYRQFYAAVQAGTLVVGGWVRVTFTGFEGQAKLYDLQVAPAGAIPHPPNATTPQAAAMPAPPQQAAPPAAAPAQGFPPAEAFGQQPAAQPEQPFGAGAPAAPWG